MKRIITIIFASLFILLGSGCQSTHMQVAPNQALTNAPTDKAQIVFMRVSVFGAAIQASLFDTTTGKPKFIGISSSDTKISYLVDPGHHTFMVTSEAADFMQANLEAGKTYYAVVTPRMGLWATRFSLQPIHKDSAYGDEFSMENKKFSKWLGETKLVLNGESALVWAQKSMPKVIKKYNEYWPKWQNKPDDEKSIATLKSTDYGE